MTNMVEYMSKLLDTVVFGNSLTAYGMALVTFLIIGVGFSIAKRFIIRHLGKLAQRTTTDFDDLLVKLFSQIGWPVFTVIALHVAISSLVVPNNVRTFVGYTVVFVVTFRVILLLQAIMQYAVNKTVLKRVGTSNPSSQALVGSVVWVLKWMMWLVGGIFILDNLGVNITSLVAGIGIGGIAVAMASQAVLGDAFSALAIYLDKPFEVGDFIIVGDLMGSVEHIGVKTTRLRSLSGEQLVFSNADLTASRVKNYKRMQTRRIAFKIGVTYQTPMEKVERIPQLIRDILVKSEVKMDRVHFLSFGDSSLVYEIVYYVLSADYNVYMDKQQLINFGIMQEFAKQGIDFAYPTQTLYLKKDS